MADLDKIEQKLDLVKAGAVPVSDNVGGIMFTSMSEVLEFAKLMSLSRNAVPRHLQGEPGTCLAVCIQALEWRMSPFAVANKSFEVNSRVAYESQLIHAVVEARAPLKQRLRCAYEGDGDNLICIVTGHFKGEADPVEYHSPEFKAITPKNSPLWKTDPRQQLWYYSVRAFARRYCPDVLLGIYAEDELKDGHRGFDNAKDVTPATGLKERLKASKPSGKGFAPENVNALEHSTEEPMGQVKLQEGEKQPVTAGAVKDAHVNDAVAAKSKAAGEGDGPSEAYAAAENMLSGYIETARNDREVRGDLKSFDEMVQRSIDELEDLTAEERISLKRLWATAKTELTRDASKSPAGRRR